MIKPEFRNEVLPFRDRSIARRCPRPRGAGGKNCAGFHARPHAFRRLALRSATWTAQRAIPTHFRFRINIMPSPSVSTGWQLNLTLAHRREGADSKVRLSTAGKATERSLCKKRNLSGPLSPKKFPVLGSDYFSTFSINSFKRVNMARGSSSNPAATRALSRICSATLAARALSVRRTASSRARMG